MSSLRAAAISIAAFAAVGLALPFVAEPNQSDCVVSYITVEATSSSVPTSVPAYSADSGSFSIRPTGTGGFSVGPTGTGTGIRPSGSAYPSGYAGSSGSSSSSHPRPSSSGVSSSVVATVSKSSYSASSYGSSSSAVAPISTGAYSAPASASSAAGGTSGTPTNTAASASGSDFNEAAQAAGKLWFGTAIDTGTAEVDNTAYMKMFNNSNMWGAVTPGNSIKWEFVEPTLGDFTFGEGMETIALAKVNDMKVRCHNLVWSSELPSWVTSPSTTWTNETLLAAMNNHIEKTIEGFGDDCYSWDVVNEALAEDGSGYQSNPFLTYIGEAYVPLAFIAATNTVKKNGYNVKLVYNDYGIEPAGTKNTAAINLVKIVQSYEAQIDAVGFESHYSTSYYPTTSDLTAGMKGFTDLGLDIFVTELDVACSSDSPSASDLATQAEAYYDTVQACMRTDRCKGMSVWDLTTSTAGSSLLQTMAREMLTCSTRHSSRIQLFRPLWKRLQAPTAVSAVLEELAKGHLSGEESRAFFYSLFSQCRYMLHTCLNISCLTLTAIWSFVIHYQQPSIDSGRIRCKDLIDF